MKPKNIAFRPKKTNLALPIFVSFHSLKTLYSIMERRVKWMDGYGLQRSDFGLPPPFLFLPVDAEHVISIIESEPEGFGVKGW